MVRRYGKRRFGGDLEYNKGITIKKINLNIKDLGYQIYKAGFDEYDFPHYGFRPIGKVTHKLKNPVVRVYALGDYTIKEWRGVLFKLLKETSPRYLKAAQERERKKKRRRER